MPNVQLFTAMTILMYVQGHNQKFYNNVYYTVKIKID